MSYNKERLKIIQRRLGIDDDGIFGVDTMSRKEYLLQADSITP